MTQHETVAAPLDINAIRRAADALSEHLSLPTPLVYSPALSERLEAHVSLKLEFANPIGAFKLRGGVTLAAELAASGAAAGLVTASTGNHGQSIAYGAALHGIEAVIFVPEGANPDKIASIRRLGAEVREEGARFDDANEAAAEFAAERGMRYVEVDGPTLIAGVATGALEVLDPHGGQQPDTDVVIVPLGGGSGACGWVLTRDGVGASCEVWAVQSAQARAGHDSWREGRVVERTNTTMAEGLATATGFEYTQAILRGRLDDFLLVDDADIGAAVVDLLEHAHLLVETAGAAALAGAVAARDRIRDRRVVLVLTGANITSEQLRGLLGAS
ncbi:MAG: pyridoxal-phosphate dependent enzyme [Chloroflexi bacterium]|nr:pyridoxal-phosphate dependent enzyme [Chloroflexota bacterium]